MTKLSKFGEIIDDGNCPSCHEPLKEEWVACPHCGAPLDVAAARIPTGYESLDRMSLRDIPSRRTVAPVTLPELRAWADSNLYADDAQEFPQEMLAFFEEHDFTFFKKLFDWAKSEDGLDYYIPLTAYIWARDHLPFFENHDFTLFKELRSWATDVKYYDDDTALSWALTALSQADAGASFKEIRRYEFE